MSKLSKDHPLWLHYPEAIRQFDDNRFSSHEFILKLARTYQHEYIKLLNTCIEHPSPFQSAHAQLAAALHDFPSMIRQVDRDYKDNDIFGNEASNSKWEKKK